MAKLYKEIFRAMGTNAAVLESTAGAHWATRLRVRMTDAEEQKYGACNVARIVNKSAKKLRLHWTYGVDLQFYEDIEANSIRNITIEDGRNFYGFDLQNLDGAADVAIGDIQYSMARVETW